MAPILSQTKPVLTLTRFINIYFNMVTIATFFRETLTAPVHSDNLQFFSEALTRMVQSDEQRNTFR